MTREQAESQLEAWMNGELGEADADVLRQHLEQHPDLKAEMQIWQDMGSLEVEEPSPALERRLGDMLEAFQAEAGIRRRRSSNPGWLAWIENLWQAQPIPALGMAAICLVLGLAGGWMLGDARSGRDEDSMSALRQELSDTREIAILAMLERPGASDRLRAVSDAASLRRPNSLVRNALLRTLRFDTSVNVRLAALDALQGQFGEPEVRIALQTAVREDTSPLVQLEVVRALAGIDHPEAQQTLEELAANPSVDAAVRDAAARSLQLEL
ncbi:MAG: HEAT repeat domain-containing protein [Bryobacterales bacterium]|nr:HEAT repeat domain-containing protein [Bryobacterales bacterium]